MLVPARRPTAADTNLSRYPTWAPDVPIHGWGGQGGTIDPGPMPAGGYHDADFGAVYVGCLQRCALPSHAPSLPAPAPLFSHARLTRCLPQIRKQATLCARAVFSWFRAIDRLKPLPLRIDVVKCASTTHTSALTPSRSTSLNFCAIKCSPCGTRYNRRAARAWILEMWTQSLGKMLWRRVSRLC